MIKKIKDYKNLINFKFNNMKKFKDLKVGDTVYKVIYTSDSNAPIRIQKERVTVIEEVSSGGTVIKTEAIEDESTFYGKYGYFINPCWYNVKYTPIGNVEIWWDKFAVQELINMHAVQYQRKFTAMLDVLKD